MQKGERVGGEKKGVGTMTEILALHGWATSIEKWEDLVKALSEKDIRLKIPSIPGLTKQVNKPWTLNDYIDWLKKLIGTKKVVLMGHSNGGRIALAFTAKYPQNIKQLILIDSSGIYHNELPLRIKRIFFKSLAKVGKKINLSNKLRNLLYKLAGESDYQKAGLVQRQTMVNLISQDLTPIFKKIKAPTLIIWGQDDKTTPLSDGKLMKLLIPNSKLKIISNARHSPHYTHPKEVAKIINEYL